MKLFTSPGLLAQMDAAIEDAKRRGDAPDHFVVSPAEMVELRALMNARGANLTLPMDTSGFPCRYYKERGGRRDMDRFNARGQYKGVWIYAVNEASHEVQ